MSKLEVNTIAPRTGTTITLGESGDTVNLGTGVSSGTGMGKLLQVVYDTLASDYSTASSSYSDTGLTLNITPLSTSSKILLMFTGRLHNQSTAAEGKLKFLRDSTGIWEGRTVYNGGSGIAANCGITVYDTPSTTSQITYKIQGKLDSGGANFMILASGDNDIATLTAMEIAQ